MRKFWNWLLLSMLLILLPGVAAYAEGGSCGENVTWELDSRGVLTISGTGPMADSEAGNSPWISDRDTLVEVIVEDGVTQVGTYAFEDLPNLTKVTLPDSVTRVGAHAFDQCTTLEFHQYGSGRYLGSEQNPHHVLVDAPGLGRQGVIHPDTRVLADGCFSNNQALSQMELPEGMLYIGAEAFADCSRLMRIGLPNSLLQIGAGSFQNCKRLLSVKLPAAVTLVGTYAFGDCKSLKNVYFLGELPQIDRNAFKNVTATVQYHFGKEGWETVTYKNYGGDLSWSEGHIYIDFVVLEQTDCMSGTTRTAKCECCDASISVVDHNLTGHRYINGVCSSCGQREDGLTGMAEYMGGLYYYRDGQVARDVTTLVKYQGEWYYLVKGQVDYDATTLVKHYGTWYYVFQGKVDFDATTLVKWNGEWFYVVNGTVASKTTTMFKWYGEWFYVKNGKVASKTTTLIKWEGSWYYIYKGKLAAKTTTLVKFNGGWYYVECGKVNFDYSGPFAYQHKTYTVQKGRVYVPTAQTAM